MAKPKTKLKTKKPPAKKPAAKKPPAKKSKPATSSSKAAGNAGATANKRTSRPAKPAAQPAQRWGARADKGTPIAAYVAKLTGEQRAIADKLVEIIQKAVPAAQSGLKWGMPMWTLDNEMLTYFRAQKHDVRFGLAAAGVELDDPNGVLFGSSDGKHVRLVTAAEIDAPRIAGWVRAVASSRTAR